MHLFVCLFFGFLILVFIPRDIAIGCAILAAVVASFLLHPLLAVGVLLVGTMVWLTVVILKGTAHAVGSIANYAASFLPSWVQRRLYERAVMNNMRPGDPDWIAEYRKMKGWDL